MKNLAVNKFMAIVLTFTLSMAICDAQILGAGSSKKFERNIFGKSINNKKTRKVKEPKKVVRAKKEQAMNEAKLKRDYAKFVKASQKHSIEIQTPEVQERMKQNKKETIVANKAKKKAARSTTKKAGKKYN
jgi:hypothetical protein